MTNNRSRNYLDKHELQVCLKTTEFLGDHSRDVTIAIAVKPEMTLEQLVNQTFPRCGNGYITSNHIEIRLAELKEKI